MRDLTTKETKGQIVTYIAALCKLYSLKQVLSMISIEETRIPKSERRAFKASVTRLHKDVKSGKVIVNGNLSGVLDANI